MSKSFANVYKKCKPSLVSIYSAEASGSGFVCQLGSSRVVVTAGHVTTVTPFLRCQGFTWGTSSGILQVPQGSGTLLFRYTPCKSDGYVVLRGLTSLVRRGEGWREESGALFSSGGEVTLEVDVKDSVSFSYSQSMGTLTCEWSHLTAVVSGQKKRLRLLGRDGKGDVAILDCEGLQMIPALLISSKTPVIGEEVAVLGNPLGIDPESIATGVVRDNAFSFSRPVTIEALTTSTASYAGNSGSPIVNLNGEVVGLLCWGIGDTLINGGPTTQLLRVIVEQLGKTRKSYLGLQLERTQPWEEVQGYRISGTNDVIVAMNGVSMQEHSPSWVTWQTPPGSKLVLDFVRDGQRKQSIIEKTLSYPLSLDTVEDVSAVLSKGQPVVRKGGKCYSPSTQM